MDAKQKSRKTTEINKIKEFISCVSDKKYAQANKYLGEVVNSKIENRINKSLEKPLF